MQTIKITDERIVQKLPVALENLKAEIIETENMTTPLEINGVTIKGNYTTTKSLGITTLKDLDNEISNLTIQLAQTQELVVKLTANLQKKNADRIEVEAVVKPAFDTNNIELAKIIIK